MGQAGYPDWSFQGSGKCSGIVSAKFWYQVYDPSGSEIYPCTEGQAVPFAVHVKVCNLRIRKGPGTTYDYYKQAGKAIHTEEGVFTITKTADGPGAKLWGLLRAYAEQENGWISLDDECVEIQ